ncbi:MAG: glycoside hydrolase family 127 protein [Ruminococcaceae bacterium]|nr:glycoside hydrolase family 127 protein [Oscillospiraceae bacterium]
MLTPISYQSCTVTGGFWENRQQINRSVTARAVYERFTDTHRFDLLKCPSRDAVEWTPHHFWDSDVAKWLEGAAYILAKHPDPWLQERAEEAIADLLANQWPDGYMNSYFTVTPAETRFTNRDRHELYTAGHLMEAACAWYESTGQDAFLKGVCRYADLIYRIFVEENSAEFVTGGHPEVELALVRLAQTTGNQKYFDLAKFFLDQRGKNAKDGPLNDWTKLLYDMSHMPLTQQTVAEGHAVRAMYLAAAMADMTEDPAYRKAAGAIFQNTTKKRMYITGGLGSQHVGEAFTLDHDLPNATAYAETCAALAMIFFAKRLLQVTPRGCYADVIERELYNGALSGVSLDGKSFFYVNPLELEPAFNQTNMATTQKIKRPITQRVEVFNCSCCPPNVLRVLASMSELLYSVEEDTLFVHQYAASEAEHQGIRVQTQTRYPADGRISIQVTGAKTAALRIPGWCERFTLNVPYDLKEGYAYAWVPADGKILLDLEMKPVWMQTNAYVPDCANKVALMRGPVVYCLEGVDNGSRLRNVLVDPNAPIGETESDSFGVPILKTKGLYRLPGEGLYGRFQNLHQEKELTLIPYFAFANRGESEMYVWLNYKLP